MTDFDLYNMEMNFSDEMLFSQLENAGSEALFESDYETAEGYVDKLFELKDINILYENPMGGDTKLGTAGEELKNFSPYENADTYNAGEAMELWKYQGNTERCAQYAQMFVIEEFTGLELDPDAFCEFSERNGWFNEKGGTSLEDTNKMLEYFGIKTEMSYGNSINDLLDCLDNDGRVIVGLDSGEYWNGEGPWEDIFNGEKADHAVEVIGYNEKTRSVILNDSGTSNGKGLEVPLDTFLDAWHDSNNFMVKCYR